MAGMSPQTYVKMAKHSAQLTHMAAETLNSTIQARKNQKKADQSAPPLVDQGEASFLNDIQNRRKNIDTGAGYASQEREGDQFAANTQNKILQASGGDTQAAIQGLLMAQRMGGQIYNEGAVTQGSQQQNFYTGMANNLVNKIADRKLQLQLADRAQYLANAASYRQQAHAQGTALLNHILDTDSAGLSGFGSGSGTNQTFNGQTPGGGTANSSSGGGGMGAGKILGMFGSGGGGGGTSRLGGTGNFASSGGIDGAGAFSQMGGATA